MLFPFAINMDDAEDFSLQPSDKFFHLQTTVTMLRTWDLSLQSATTISSAINRDNAKDFLLQQSTILFICNNSAVTANNPGPFVAESNSPFMTQKFFVAAKPQPFSFANDSDAATKILGPFVASSNSPFFAIKRSKTENPSLQPTDNLFLISKLGTLDLLLQPATTLFFICH